MSTVHARIEIAAPRQEVWDTIMDPNRLGEWVTIHRGVKDVSDDLHEGAGMEQTLCMRGVNFHVRWTLAKMDEPNHAEWEGKGPARSRAKISYDLAEDGDNCTVFEYTNEFQPPGGMLGNVASRVIVGAASEREANNSLGRLKALLEKN